jgi:two-component system cell cycle response regulator DivK
MADTVLVVEDDPANALLVETILRRLGGFEVIRSHDGDEILEIVTSRPISAALMDVSLKDTRVSGDKVDGVELTRRIRSLPGGVGLPVILLTAHAMKGDRERLLFSSGANDYVAKPIADQRELVSLVRRHIETVQDLQDDGVDA